MNYVVLIGGNNPSRCPPAAIKRKKRRNYLVPVERGQSVAIFGSVDAARAAIRRTRAAGKSESDLFRVPVEMHWRRWTAGIWRRCEAHSRGCWR